MPGYGCVTLRGGLGHPLRGGRAQAGVKGRCDGSVLIVTWNRSPDNSFTAEALLAVRIEVLRGPATRLYGGGAIGGVVNVLDRKIPTAVPENGVEAEAEVRGATGTGERAGTVGITAGTGEFAVRVEGLKRRSDDYDVPDWPGGALEIGRAHV